MTTERRYSEKPPGPHPGSPSFADAARLAELDGEREAMWVDVIARMEEVYSDLLRYEADLESKNAELEEAQSFISGVIASISDILVVIDASGSVLQVNPAFVRLIGATEAELVGRPLATRLAEEDVDAAKILASGDGGDLELKFLTSDGRATDLMALASAPRLDHAGRPAGAVVTGRPVGELRRAYQALHRAHLDLQNAQRKLVEQEKMASLGRLVAGVAHELNNPISFVRGNAHTLDRYRERLTQFFDELGSDGEVRQMRARHRIDQLLADLPSLIDGTIEGAARVADIVRNLRRLSFTRPDSVDSLDLVQVVRNASVWAAKAKGGAAEIAFELPESCIIEGQEGELHQIVVNLVENALDAVRDRPAPRVRVGMERRSEAVDIVIEDNGPGVPPDLVDKIFEPFFTTKQVGEGTGLGLWISYSIARHHGGELHLEPSPTGARFVVRLPARG